MRKRTLELLNGLEYSLDQIPPKRPQLRAVVSADGPDVERERDRPLSGEYLPTGSDSLESVVVSIFSARN